MNVRFLSRSQINDVAWDACVAASSNQIVYSYSWYLDAVTSLSNWSWVGLVVPEKEGRYQAVMPIPLRRKWGRWVVHQPLFCQVLGIFSLDPVDPVPFFAAMQRRFRYGSGLYCQQVPPTPWSNLQTRPLCTHLLDLSPDYKRIARHYTRDRKLNLRRAELYNWLVIRSSDLEPLIQLFQENHAAGVPNGVAPWAYTLFRNLFAELQKRGLATLRYALKDGQIQAGALFVREGNRIIYLFNAASELGRRGNARTLLIDQVVRENAGCCNAGNTLVLDFESPEKPSVVQFYESFGTVAEPFWVVNYNLLTWAERKLRAYLNAFAS